MLFVQKVGENGDSLPSPACRIACFPQSNSRKAAEKQQLRFYRDLNRSTDKRPLLFGDSWPQAGQRSRKRAVNGVEPILGAGN